MQKVKQLTKPKIDIISIEPQYIDKFWPLCDFMIAEALQYSGGFASPHHIKDLLKKDEAQLFLAFGNDEEELNQVFALMVTRIAALPNFNQLEAIITTGKKRYLWEDALVSTVTKFAKLNNCKKLSFWCRPGWARVSKKWGWKVKHIQMERDV
jgi:hypothetical protein|tara:strand:+ start:182 stop:640 length:459 start_codon:yes stop_codon:yes gene_type:complete